MKRYEDFENKQDINAEDGYIAWLFEKKMLFLQNNIVHVKGCYREAKSRDPT
jgi:hypothetical protein